VIVEFGGCACQPYRLTFLKHIYNERADGFPTPREQPRRLILRNSV
jgi:hypothetical protein